jgi:tetratricopeptide (TPR) repeat protein
MLSKPNITEDKFRELSEDFEETLKYLDKALKLDPKRVKTFIKRAYVKYMLGKFHGALEDCDVAIKLDPQESKAFMMRTEIKFELGKFTEALEDCDMAIKLNPKDLDAFMLKTNINTNLGNFKEILTNFAMYTITIYTDGFIRRDSITKMRECLDENFAKQRNSLVFLYQELLQKQEATFKARKNKSKFKSLQHEVIKIAEQIIRVMELPSLQTTQFFKRRDYTDVKIICSQVFGSEQDGQKKRQKEGAVLQKHHT